MEKYVLVLTAVSALTEVILFIYGVSTFLPISF